MKSKVFEEKVCDYGGYLIYHVTGKEPDLYEVWKNGKQVYTCDTEQEAIEWIDGLNESVRELAKVKKVRLLTNKILAGKDIRSSILESTCYLKEDDQEYWDYIHDYGDDEEREKAADYFDVTPSAFDYTYADFYELDESRKFEVGKKFLYTDKYGANHECTVLSKDLFDEYDYSDYAIGTMTFSYPTMGSPHKETVRIFKSEQGDSYGDEYFVSDTTKTKSGFGIASWAFPNRVIESKNIDIET